MDDGSQETALAVTDVLPGISIRATVAAKVSIASYQNAIPVLRDVAVTNNGPESIVDAVLTLACDPPVFQTRTWHVDQLAAGQDLRLTDLDIALDGTLLAQLTEAQTATATFVLRADGNELARQSHHFELLARNEWGGSSFVPEMLAALVQPNDSAVDRLLKKAAETLRQHGRSSLLNGYEEGPQHAWELASALWTAVGGMGLDYAFPPASFEQASQKVRGPSQIADAGLATCLDSTLLFCAALEQCGLNPLIVILRGHSFAGVWLKQEAFGTVIMDDVTALRKRIRLNEAVFFETTLVTQRPCPSFAAAVTSATQQLAEPEADKFELAIDVRRARMLRIRPVTSEQPAALAADDDAPPAVLEPGFEAAPLLTVLSGQGDAGTKPDGAEDRLNRWQRRLFDLSLRNNLLNFRVTRRALPLDAPDPGRLEDMLSEGQTLKLAPRPNLMEGNDLRSRTLYEARAQEDVRRAYALEALQRNEVLVSLPQQEMEIRLVELYRTTRAALEEGGANTLFLALGFLSWKRDDKDERPYRAPLILVPVSLHRRSVRSGFTLGIHDDEPRFNPTLIEMLRQDFKLELPVLQGELPKDDAGLDIQGIWRAVARAIKDIRGWEVVEDVVLSTFSFAKYLMWKDLSDRTDQLRQNLVVRHLIDTPREAYPNGAGFIDPRTLDATQRPEETFCPLPADSSQLAAVVTAAKGQDFVLVGPPGTGKSQTIANLIAQCVAQGKSVLFVSEKMAALDVVYRRLRDVGLGEFCLELHSSKARKLEVLAELRRAWEAQGVLDAAEWASEARRLANLRDQLNTFVQRLHLRHRNGMTVFTAIGKVVSGAASALPTLAWPSADEHDAEAYAALVELAERLDINAAEVQGQMQGPLALIGRSEWSSQWQQSLAAVARTVISAADNIHATAQRLSSRAGLPDVPLTRNGRDGLALLAAHLPDAAGHDWRWVLQPDAGTVAASLRQGLALLERHTQVAAELSVPYRPTWRDLDLPRLKTDWGKAERSWWPMSWLGRRSVRGGLAGVIEGNEKPNVAADLDRLLQLRDLEREIGAFSGLSEKTGGLWSGLTTNVDEVQRALEFQQALALALAFLAETPGALDAFHQPLAQLIGSGNILLQRGGALALAADAYAEAAKQWNTAIDGFVAVAETAPEQCAARADDVPAALANACEGILGVEHRLRAWCAWRKAANEATLAGLAPLVVALEQGAVAPGQVRHVFETAYARWWLNVAVDNDEVLRTFVSAEHEKRIRDFKALDDRFTELTRAYVRARLCAEIPDQNAVGRSPEWGLLNRQLQMRRPRMPVRTLLREIPTALTKLTPCLLMSPLSIAQYLDAATTRFDLVVFDEASQIPVWDAIGAIARGKQVVMVGDPKQLPPTSFFARAQMADDGSDDSVLADEEMESILDECLAANLPAMNLSWHYRSRHESLIAFSNHRYYGGGLVTFPAPVTSDRAVSFHWVPDGVYAKGGARTNQREAQALVADLVAHLKDPAFRSASPPLTIGVVTFNIEQQRLIEDLLDEERRRSPELEPYFAEDALEPVFVKNLESVQGDERDLMYFSITYGPDLSGAVSMNFGPMNREGGERRLNVAITRARHELRVFSSLLPEKIDLSRTAALGVSDLKHFLEFAQRGARALAERVNRPGGDFESPFEQAVAVALERKGWIVYPQVGVSSFRIDLGIVDPNAPGRYLAGVECDGATYHRSATARDRDKLREHLLRGLGWEMLRVWSTDWWHDPAGSLEKLHTRLEALRDLRRAAARSAAPIPQPSDTEAAHAQVEGQQLYPPSEDVTATAVGAPGDETISEGSPLAPLTAPIAGSMSARSFPSQADIIESGSVFREVDPDALAMGARPNAFFEPSHDPQLLTMITRVIEQDGPVRDDVLARRIARAHGWGRAGERIRERVVELANAAFPWTSEEGRVYYWPSGSDTTTWQVFRRPQAGTVRSLDEIALPELVALAREMKGRGVTGEAAVSAMATAAGLQRLRAPSQERLQRAWSAVAGEA